MTRVPIVTWLGQGELELVAIYVAQMRRLQRLGATWPEAARQHHRQN
jgi:hypothetical protein